MNSQSPLDRFPEWFRPKSRRVMAMLVVVMLAIFMLQFLSQPMPQQMCSLIDDCEIKSNERHRIIFALGAAGLGDFEIEDKQIMVPKHARAKYLKALADQNVLPAALATTSEEATEVNLFMPRSQQKMIANTKKKQRLREMIMRLPFVSEAWLEIDNTSTGTAFRSPVQTAVVMVQPTEHYSLDRQQIETIKGLIGGAIANMKPENIVVTDINVGIAYDNLDDQRQNDLLQSVGYKSERHRFYQSRIERALAGIKGVEVDVQVDYQRNTLRDNVAAAEQHQPQPHLVDYNSVRKLQKPVTAESNVRVIAYEAAANKTPLSLEPRDDFEPATNVTESNVVDQSENMFGGANGVASIEEQPIEEQPIEQPVEQPMEQPNNSFSPVADEPRIETPSASSDFEPPTSLPQAPTTPPVVLPSAQFEPPKRVAQLPSFQTIEPAPPTPIHIPNTLSGSIPNTVQNSGPEMDLDTIPNFIATPTELVSVIVRVPKETIERVMATSDVSHSEQVHLLKAEIINLVKPILPATSFGSVFPITILLPHEAPITSLSTGDKKVMRALQTYWPLAAVLMISTMALAYTRRKTPTVSSATASSLSQLQETDSDELRSQLTRLIDNDPETAAKVIKSWIRQS